ncbi:hypothetical protein MFIFM68171_05992 [Madurella fahalii]|uniref:Uncharacterized protein n=1 Tax=Madurella fahalii TaxID=1157608 RepID=A0ABQ0GDF4_9PEZI
MPSLRIPIQSSLRVCALRSAAVPAISMVIARQYHPTGSLSSYKDDQDRESLRPRSSEGTNSGTNFDVAEKKDAFNPKTTDPETEKEAAGRESNGNPLEVSGANREYSKPQNPEEATDRSDKKTRSTTSKGKKHGNVGPM